YNATVGTHLQSGILNYNQVPTPVLNDLVARFGETQALNILRSDISSAAAKSAGIDSPYPSFVNQQAHTVNQALRPFPQYSTISQDPQKGQNRPPSPYRPLPYKADRRFSRDLSGQWSYLLSKLITDSDTSFANSATAAEDQDTRRLEKSIGQYDRTHTFKF